MLWQNRLYCSVQLKMVSLLIWIVYCFEHFAKKAKFWQNTKSIIREFSAISGNFWQCEILISLECTVDSEWSDVTSCLNAKLFIWQNHKKVQSTTTTLVFSNFCHQNLIVLYCSAWSILWVIETSAKAHLTVLEALNLVLEPMPGDLNHHSQCAVVYSWCYRDHATQYKTHVTKLPSLRLEGGLFWAVTWLLIVVEVAI